MFSYGMTQRELLLEMFRTNNGAVTLGQIMHTTLAAEYRARISELRKEGYVILCEKGKTPSENIYRLIAPDKTGQLKFCA